MSKTTQRLTPAIVRTHPSRALLLMAALASGCASRPGGSSGDPGGVDPCASYGSCSTCTAAPSCGWCAGQCLRGVSSGPTSGSCGGAAWAYVSSQCSGGTTSPPPSSDPCGSSTTCSACAARSGCGWCGGRCLSGTSSGPTAGSCGGSSWAWLPAQCGASGGGSGRACDFPNDPSVCGCGGACVDATSTCRACGSRGSGCAAEDIYCCSDAHCPPGRYCSTLSSSRSIGYHVCVPASALTACRSTRDCFQGEICSGGFCREND